MPFLAPVSHMHYIEKTSTIPYIPTSGSRNHLSYVMMKINEKFRALWLTPAIGENKRNDDRQIRKITLHRTNPPNKFTMHPPYTLLPEMGHRYQKGRLLGKDRTLVSIRSIFNTTWFPATEPKLAFDHGGICSDRSIECFIFQDHSAWYSTLFREIRMRKRIPRRQFTIFFQSRFLEHAESSLVTTRWIFFWLTHWVF